MRSFIAIILLIISCAACRNEAAVTTRSTKNDNKQSIDEAISEAASSELGDRDGSVVVLDARDGRVRSVINPESAWQHDYPLGSVIKPFVAAAMLRDKTLDPDRQFHCPGKIRIGQISIRCSHQPQLQPITLSRALAISCNSYFATASKDLNISTLRGELQSRGFGRLTGLDATHEQAGRLEPSVSNLESQAAISIGETDLITATPLGLATEVLSLVS